MRGAFGGKRTIMEQFDPSKPNALPHAGTFNNNTLTMTAGVAGLTEVFTPEACVELNARGDGLRDALNELFMQYQVRMRATGVGSMITLHPVAGDLRSPLDVRMVDTRLKRLLFLDLLEQGIYIAERGFMALSLLVSEAHCAQVAASVESFIRNRRELLV